MLFKRKERNILGRRVQRGQLTFEQVASIPRDDLLNLLDLGYQLPMAGGTTAQNQTAASPIYFPRAIVVTVDVGINQADLVWWDPINYTLKPVTAPNQVAVSTTGGYCGVAAGTSAPGLYPTPPSGVSEMLPGIMVQRGGSAYLNATPADGGYAPFQPVTVGADAQTVTRAGVTVANRVGFVVVSPPVNARAASGATPAPETDNSGRPQVWLSPTFPTPALV